MSARGGRLVRNTAQLCDNGWSGTTKEGPGTADTARGAFPRRIPVRLPQSIIIPARPGRSGLPTSERFWRQVDKDGPLLCPELGVCWRWLGPTHPRQGHARFNWWAKRAGGRKAGQLGHRFSWELHNGPVPDGLCVLHRCDNPPCTNPAHLFLGTRADNMHDMYAKKRDRYSRGNRLAAHPFPRKYSTEQIEEMRARVAVGQRGIQTQIAKEYGISLAHLSQIVHGQRRKND